MAILAKFPNITRTINPKLYSQSHNYVMLPSLGVGLDKRESIKARTYEKIAQYYYHAIDI